MTNEDARGAMAEAARIAGTTSSDEEAIAILAKPGCGKIHAVVGRFGMQVRHAKMLIDASAAWSAVRARESRLQGELERLAGEVERGE